MLYKNRLALVFLLCAMVLLLPYFGLDFSSLPGDLGDTRFNLYVLEHNYLYFFGLITDFWGAPFMYPEAEVISLSDNLIGSAPIFMAARLLGFSLFTAMQIWIVILFFLNFYGAYVLGNYILKNKNAAIIVAVVFTFSIGLAEQMNHAQLFPRFPIPLTIFFCLKWFNSFQPKYFFLFVTFYTYQFYCGIYLGFLLSVPLFLIVIYKVGVNFKVVLNSMLNLKNAFTIFFTLTINIFLLLYLFKPYMRRALFSETFDYEKIMGTVPSLYSHLSSSDSSLLWSWTSNFSLHEKYPWDHRIFPGIIACMGFLFLMSFLFRKKSGEHLNRKNILLLSGVGLVTFLLFLRIGQFSLYQFINQIPGFESMRSIARIVNVQLIFYGLGVGLLFLFISKYFKRYTKFVFIFFLFALIADNFTLKNRINNLSKKSFENRLEDMINKLQHIPRGSIISYEPKTIEGDVRFMHIDVMLASQQLGLTSVNGYSGQAPYMFERFWKEPNTENRAYFLKRFDQTASENILVISD